MAGSGSYLDEAVDKIEGDGDAFDASKGRGKAGAKVDGKGSITFYVDVVSPFGYLAFWMLRNSPVFKEVDKTYVPILLGGLHKQCGNVAPILIKNKKEWINKERERWAEIFKIPLREGVPRGFPVSTVNAMRSLTALQSEVDNETFAKAIEVLWSALWCPQADVLREVKGRDAEGEFEIKSPDTIAALLGSVEGVGEELAKKVVGRTGEKDVKDKLVGNTNEAFEKGAFGMPWFGCVNGKGEAEGFWGFDHLGQVGRFMGLDGDLGGQGGSGGKLRALL